MRECQAIQDNVAFGLVGNDDADFVDEPLVLGDFVLDELAVLVRRVVERFDISREAAMRRYVALHRECLAAVFSQNGIILSVAKPEGFPSTSRWKGDRIGPHPSLPRDG